MHIRIISSSSLYQESKLSQICKVSISESLLAIRESVKNDVFQIIYHLNTNLLYYLRPLRFCPTERRWISNALDTPLNRLLQIIIRNIQTNSEARSSGFDLVKPHQCNRFIFSFGFIRSIHSSKLRLSMLMNR